MEILEIEQKRTSFPENLLNQRQLLPCHDFLSQKTRALIESLARSDSKKATIINQAFKDWVNSSKMFEFAKQLRGNAFPLALILTMLVGILTVPVLLITPLLPSEILMLLATPVCMLLTLPQICVLIEVSIEKFIHTQQQNMENFSRKLIAYSEETEKKLTPPNAEEKSQHCIIEGFKMTQYGTMFSIAPDKNQQNPVTVNFAMK